MTFTNMSRWGKVGFAGARREETVWYKNRVCQSAYGLNRNRVGGQWGQNLHWGTLISGYCSRGSLGGAVPALGKSGYSKWGHKRSGTVWGIRRSDGRSVGAVRRDLRARWHTPCARRGRPALLGQRGSAGGLSIARWIERPRRTTRGVLSPQVVCPVPAYCRVGTGRPSH